MFLWTSAAKEPTVQLIHDKWMHMEQRWNDINREKPKDSEKNLRQCQFAHHKSDVHCSGREPWAFTMRSRNQPPAPWHGPGLVKLLFTAFTLFRKALWTWYKFSYLPDALPVCELCNVYLFMCYASICLNELYRPIHVCVCRLDCVSVYRPKSEIYIRFHSI
jgi:hypothetical protein